MDTGYYIHADHRIFGPTGRTPWWAVVQGGVEIIWGRSGDTGWRLAGEMFFDPQGKQTSYFVVANGGKRLIHGPAQALPWVPGATVEVDAPFGLRPPKGG